MVPPRSSTSRQGETYWRRTCRGLLREGREKSACSRVQVDGQLMGVGQARSLELRLATTSCDLSQMLVAPTLCHNPAPFHYRTSHPLVATACNIRLRPHAGPAHQPLRQAPSHFHSPNPQPPVAIASSASDLYRPLAIKTSTPARIVQSGHRFAE